VDAAGVDDGVGAACPQVAGLVEAQARGALQDDVEAVAAGVADKPGIPGSRRQGRSVSRRDTRGECSTTR
jgi:hypothetical protein